jgi:hypothetical protein
MPTERPPIVGEVVPTFADRGCCAVSATDPLVVNLGTRPCKQATIPEPSLFNESAGNNGGTIGGGAFYAVSAEAIWEGRLDKPSEPAACSESMRLEREIASLQSRGTSAVGSRHRAT